MKRYSKLLVLLVVAAFVLSLAGVASAAVFSDIDDSPAKGDIVKLNALGIINGYPDGTFKPGATITRAEFAKIAVIAAGYTEKEADMLASVSQYTDVPANEWYTGWINLATAKGLVKGYGDGRFGPNDEVTYEQVVTVLMRLLGYDDRLSGEWPYDYLIEAAKIELIKDVTFVTGTPAPRGDVAILTSTALDTNVANWDDEKEDFVVDTTTTLLAENFSGKSFVQDLTVTGWKVDNDGKFVITVDTQDTNLTEATLAEDANIVGGLIVPYLVNHKVDVVYNEDDDEIAYINVKSTLLKSDDVEKNDDGDIEVDGTAYENPDNLDVPLGEYFKVYLNDDNEVYKIVAVTNGGNPVLFKEYDADTDVISFKNDAAGPFDLDNYDEEDVLIVKDGQIADIDDLVENDVVYVTEDTNGNYHGLKLYLEAFSFSNSGELVSAYKEDGKVVELKIGSKKYSMTEASVKISTDNGDEFGAFDYDKLIDAFGTTVKFAVDKQNKLVYIAADIDEEEPTELYGSFVDVVDVNYKDQVTKVKLFTENGSTVTYSVDLDEITPIYENDGVTEAVYLGSDKFVTDTFVQFSLNDAGEIEALTALTTNGAITAADADTNRVKINGNWYFVTDNTVIINTDYNDADDDKEADLEDVADFLSYAEDNASDLNPIAVVFKEDGNEVEYLLISEELTVTEEGEYGIVTDLYSIGEDDYVEIDGTRYELATGGLNGAAVDDFVKYDLVDGKVTLTVEFDADADHTAEKKAVTDRDLSNNAIEIADYWYLFDGDTVVVDYTGDDPEYSTVSSVAVDDNVVFVEYGEGDDKPEDTLKFIFIVE
ncbi:S-layer homology domain-containing protein [Calderihabitans maritimus]|uniref:SLH domain-containing protein n=1 Tax=Calderihabitans maritimus TaxID=1246530 RepID=A0A1Z5HWE8_9FIRM|nr:S-layer homology domain-containing protein [Calderihabitans maritimus]GAW93856.1 exported hypothetical protein [Calderihabitans maritimus]